MLGCPRRSESFLASRMAHGVLTDGIDAVPVDARVRSTLGTLAGPRGTLEVLADVGLLSTLSIVAGRAERSRVEPMRCTLMLRCCRRSQSRPGS